MGYTTEFTGAVKLGRKLTMAEAKILLEINEDGRDASKNATGIDAYFQWVPSDDLQHIVWDGNEKFYKYLEQLRWLCSWLHVRGVSANGTMYWQGEEIGDTGTITVIENDVTAMRQSRPPANSPKPLTMSDLRAMALDQVTGT